MKYTDKEIRLYEGLTEIGIISENMSEIFSKSVQNYANQKKKEMDKWVGKIVNNLVDLNKVLKKTKIPKKFRILNKLEDKNG